MQAKKRPGRPQTTPPKYPLQQEKMAELTAHLKKEGVIRSQEELAHYFGVDDQTISNWATGKSALGLRDKKVFAHDFDVPLNWWNHPGVPIAKVIGKGLGQDEPPRKSPDTTRLDLAAYLRQVVDYLTRHAKELEKKPHQNHENLTQP